MEESQHRRQHYSTIKIVQDSPRNRDFSSADRYGALDVVLGQNDRPSRTPNESYRKILKNMQNFDTNDFIINAGGDPLAPILFGYALAQLNIEAFKFLRWERKRLQDGTYSQEGFYMPVLFEPKGT